MSRPARIEMTSQRHRTILTNRIRARLPEVEKAIFAGVRQMAEPSSSDHPVYLAGMERAVAAAVEHGVAGIEHGIDVPSPLPAEAGEQARRAAREGIKLETVMRRYAGGGQLLEEFIVIEAEGLPTSFLAEILAEQGQIVDRFMEFVSAAYNEERER